ncbi:Uncharacterised protein [Mycobacteroides abscessus subsp. abscessus]|nr:Uncharacterised protein [Mycobacteroides abscessus subsp. abscessus]
MWVTVFGSRRKLHRVDQLGHPGDNFAPITATVHPHGFGDAVAHAHLRVERGSRILEHEPELGSQRAQLALAHAHDLLAEHPHRPRGGLLQGRHASADGGLS